MADGAEERRLANLGQEGDARIDMEEIDPLLPVLSAETLQRHTDIAYLRGKWGTLPEEPELGSANVVCVRVNFPNGVRFVRRFRTKDSLEVCIHFVLSLE